MNRCVLAALLWLLTGPLWAQPALTPASFSTVEIDTALERALSDHRLVGAVLLISENGQLVYQKAVGLADRESGTATTLNTIFRLASVTKPMVSAAALKLVEQGKLSLDDPVRRWLPSFTPRLEDGSRPEITIAQLLNHTSGLSYGFHEPLDSPYHLLGISDGVDQRGLTLAENLTRLGQAPLLHPPGTAFKYSLATDVLGAVIAEVVAKPLPEAMRSLLLDPLEMKDTGFRVDQRERLATPYANSKFGPIRMVDGTVLAFSASFLRVEPSLAWAASAYPSGGGGMVGTAGDFMRFLEVIRQGGAPLLSESTVAQMCADQLSSEMAGHKPGWGFGCGWAVLRDPALGKTPQSPGTLQWGGAYGNFWFVDPSRKLSLVLLTNTAFEGMAGKLVVEIRDAVYRLKTTPESVPTP